MSDRAKKEDAERRPLSFYFKVFMDLMNEVNQMAGVDERDGGGFPCPNTHPTVSSDRGLGAYSLNVLFTA